MWPLNCSGAARLSGPISQTRTTLHGQRFSRLLFPRASSTPFLSQTIRKEVDRPHAKTSRDKVATGPFRLDGPNRTQNLGPALAFVDQIYPLDRTFTTCSISEELGART